ncbi:hypothetical protein MGS_00503 [Candida albicans P78042]|nr:hypothetical protein MG7_00495 [Candida albicans P34048]KGU37722.1 hypothetical protein MGK_00499 [Candida albicans P57055]KHC85110.1 hypothetical protein MGS_00503 [Candida albicans P78042]
MAKKSEELNVVSSEPLDSIDDSSKKDTTVSTDDKESTTTSEDNKQEKTEESKPEEKKEESKPTDTTSETKPETKSEAKIEAKTEPKKDRKSVSFKKEIDSTEEVPINEDEQDESVPPPQPPRPKDPTQEIIDDMKQAFPNIEEKYIIATLIASQGNPDPAFNALLYISDPTFKPEIPVYKPPALASSTGPVGTGGGGRNQKELTDDELLARKLQKEFELEDERNRRNRRRSSHERQRVEQQRQRQHRRGDDDDELDDSPDEFEQIKETFTQGLEEAKSTLNGWVSNIAKRFEGNNDGNNPQQRRNDNPKLFGALGGSSFNDNKRKTNRFDEDPEILSTDFHDGIRLQDNDDHGPSLPNRPKGELQSDTPTLTTREKGATDKKKWQPLESGVSADPDAFLVTDSEDDGEDVATTDATKNTTISSTKK